MLTYSETDVNYDTAYNAHRNTSWEPERRAVDTQKGYVNEMQTLVAEFGRFATEENETELWADLAHYQCSYLAHLNGFLHSRSRVASAFVTGPANFPTERNNKRADAAHKKLENWLAWQETALARLRRKYDPKLIARAPIKGNDPDAVIKLQEKIDQAKARQELMKAANRVLRKKIDDAEKIAQLIKLGHSEDRACQLLQPDFAQRIGFADYQLSNNLANIKRMEQRIEQVEREQARAPQEVVELPGSVRVVENKEAGRLQIFFPGKPEREVINVLKSRGFHWSPSIKAWQRFLNDNARYDAKQILEKVK